jgi:pimeloyl-ACP methyl ester carboxylesterase
MDHSFVAANGVRFHVVAEGPEEAPLLLCLHGFPELWYSWRHVLARLSKRFRVVAPDLRGYGESDKPPSGYDAATLARDVRELVGALGRSRCFLVGHDWGGVVAYETAMRHPECVERLIILNAPHPATFARALLTNPRQLLRSWYIFLFQVPGLPERLLAAGDGRAIERAFDNVPGITDEDRQVYRKAMLRPGALEKALEYYRVAFRHALSPRRLFARLPRIVAPTLVLWGEEDPALGSELTHGMERLFEGPLTVRYLPGVGHWTQQEAPEEVCRAIGSFLSEGGA